MSEPGDTTRGNACSNARNGRRAFLGAAAAGIGGVIFGCRGDGDTDASAVAATATPQLLPEGLPLRTMERLRNDSADPSLVTATLVAAEAEASPLPGRSTSLLLYNAHAPGPLIELREGQRVRVKLDNRLAQSSTIHWHGLPVPPDQDGNPMDPVPAGTSRIYEFDLPEGTAGTYWYHPHPHGETASQVARGLAGPLIVRAADDPLANIPEVSMFITGLALDRDGQIAPDNAIDWTVGRQQDVLLVNGGRLPVHAMRPGATERWRIFNATAAVHLRLTLEGHEFTLVGTDGGLLGAPVAGLTEFLLGPAQRIELIVRANGVPNGRYRLRALRFQAASSVGVFARASRLAL